MQVKYAYLPQQFDDFDDYIPLLREWVSSGEYTLGPYVKKFEDQFAAYNGSQFCIGTNSGTDALILALKAVGIQSGDEVITVVNTFYATAGAIAAVGAAPIFVDCDKRFSIDVDKIEEKITKKTKAIIPVHWAGMPANMEAICQLAQTYQLKVIEDACPAVGATVNGEKVGTFGHVNAFSMHPLKPLNVWGDGGMITTNDPEINDWLRLYQNHGLTDRNHIAFWGVNKRLQPIQAIVASRILDQVEQMNQLRIRNAKLLDEGLSSLQELVFVPSRLKQIKEVYQLYLVCVKKRESLIQFMYDRGIEVKVHYPIPLHLQKPSLEQGYKKGDYPVAEKQAEEILTIPAHQYITPEQIQYIIDSFKSFYKSN